MSNKSPTNNHWSDLGDPGGYAISAPLVTNVELLLNDTNIMRNGNYV